MKPLRFALFLLASLCIAGAQSESPRSMNPEHGKKSERAFDIEDGEVLKVYSAKRNGAVYRAYVVDWEGDEIVIEDQMGASEHEVGDTVEFLAQRIEMNLGGEDVKVLQFSLFDVPKIKRNSRNQRSGGPASPPGTAGTL